MSRSSRSSTLSNPNSGSGPYEQQLIAACRVLGYRYPVFQVISDRRGGRTAWSAQVLVHGQTIQARFWYDGSNANQAREDAAQIALQLMGQLPSTGDSQAQLVEQQKQLQAQYQQQQQQQQQQQPPPPPPPQSPQGGSQQRIYRAHNNRGFQ